MARSQGMKVNFIRGARLTDEVFTITLRSGECVTWNVTKLNAAALRGEFGAVRYAPTIDLPPARWEEWDARDRATVDYIKKCPELLEAPAIAIASPRPDFLLSCFADGQHRITARQELGLPEFAFYLVPLDQERAFRVEGFSDIARNEGENR